MQRPAVLQWGWLRRRWFVAQRSSSPPPLAGKSGRPRLEFRRVRYALPDPDSLRSPDRRMANPPRPGDEDLLARTMGGACPFEDGDPRRELWLMAARIGREAEARLQAEMLAKLPNARADEAVGLLVETQVRRFDYTFSLGLASVSDYSSAALFEHTLARGHAYLLEWFENLVRDKAPWLLETGLVGQLRLRLDQRVAHWTAEGLRAARNVELNVDSAPPQAAAAGSAAEAVSAIPGPAFPARGAWLQSELDKRGWTVHDPHRFGGPDYRTVRKILAGDPVAQVVLEKIASALSSKGGRVSVRDAPPN